MTTPDPLELASDFDLERLTRETRGDARLVARIRAEKERRGYRGGSGDGGAGGEVEPPREVNVNDWLRGAVQRSRERSMDEKRRDE